MNAWSMLHGLYFSLLEVLKPLLDYEFAGFTYWQYGLFAFLICSVTRFLFPLISGGSLSVGGPTFVSTESDTVTTQSIRSGGKVRTRVVSTHSESVRRSERRRA